MRQMVQSLVNMIDDVDSSVHEFEELDKEIYKMQQASETIASAAEESAGAVSEVTQTITMQASAFKQSNEAALMLNSLTNKLSNNSDDIEIINELASAAEELSAAIDEIENSMKQSSIALNQIEEAAEISKDDASKASIIANSSIEISNRVYNTIKDINQQTIQIQKNFTQSVESVEIAGVRSKENLKDNEEVLSDAKQIKKDTKRLKKILRKIELTFVQTASLSINSSVEAMRVGELGEGFSVVSNDIRNLAESSEESLDKINDIVDNLEDETDEIIEVVNKIVTLGVKEAEDLIVLSSDMKDSSEEISKNVDVFNEIQNRIEEIDEALKQSQIASQQIQQASNLAFDNTNESKQAAQSITKTTNIMADKVTELVDLAAVLKDK